MEKELDKRTVRSLDLFVNEMNSYNKLIASEYSIIPESHNIYSYIGVLNMKYGPQAYIVSEGLERLRKRLGLDFDCFSIELKKRLFN
jgi:hypothetical protein